MSKAKQSYPWITPGVKQAQQQRDRLYVKAKNVKFIQYWNLFKEYRQKVKEEIRASHKAYVQDIVREIIAENPQT